MTPTYTHTGKQVLRDGQHFADAIDPDVAAEIVSALRGDEPSRQVRMLLFIYEWFNDKQPHEVSDAIDAFEHAEREKAT